MTPTLTIENSFLPLLEKMVADPLTHSRWLNTLSLLEHMGAKKIHSLPISIDTDLGFLQHAAEESRHAYFFKKWASRIREDASPNTRSLGFGADDLLAPRSAVFYFQRLDGMVRSALRKMDLDPISSRKLSYLLVTRLIEERAVKIYQIYDGLLEKSGSSFRLSSLLKEEEGHLEEMGEMMQSETKAIRLLWETLCQKEEKYFLKFQSSILN